MSSAPPLQGQGPLAQRDALRILHEEQLDPLGLLLSLDTGCKDKHHEDSEQACRLFQFGTSSPYYYLPLLP